MAFRCSKPQHYSWPKNVLDSLILKNITLMSELFQFISYHFKMFLRVISQTGFVACEQLEPRNNKKCQISVSWKQALCRSSADLLPHPEMYTSSPDMALLTVSCVLCPSQTAQALPSVPVWCTLLSFQAVSVSACVCPRVRVLWMCYSTVSCRLVTTWRYLVWRQCEAAGGEPKLAWGKCLIIRADPPPPEAGVGVGQDLPFVTIDFWAFY